MKRPRRSSQRGSATVLALPLLGTLTLAALLLALVGGALATRRSAASAADLAALAGAAAVQQGRDGCAEAAAIAARNGAVVSECRVEGRELRVTVRAEAARLFGRGVTVTARARAGPG